MPRPGLAPSTGPGRGELFRERPEEFSVQQADGERGDLDDPRGHAELDTGLAILFVGAPPRSLSSNALRTHVLTGFEDGIAEALALRFTQQATDEPPHRRALRASVLARAAVAAVRSALIAYSSDDTPDADNPSAGDFRALLQEAFEVLRGAA
ncbi:hypothetical protein ACIBI8_14925 [Streptomyces sp. NPDC050529]|uniref:hypothetical protein n=1 Tax=Streptomyces sp. NPDC050529 TaxID=3365624 RepID=UPI003790B8B3